MILAECGLLATDCRQTVFVLYRMEYNIVKYQKRLQRTEEKTDEQNDADETVVSRKRSVRK